MPIDCFGFPIGFLWLFSLGDNRWNSVLHSFWFAKTNANFEIAIGFISLTKFACNKIRPGRGIWNAIFLIGGKMFASDSIRCRCYKGWKITWFWNAYGIKTSNDRLLYRNKKICRHFVICNKPSWLGLSSVQNSTYDVVIASYKRLKFSPHYLDKCKRNNNSIGISPVLIQLYPSHSPESIYEVCSFWWH